uniref:Uncharacterized protein n=1 Tax=Neovison vison TaxID=452646 RepID=A0A8C7ALI8_NEOVI
MEEAKKCGDITWHNFSATVGTVVHFLVMRLMDSLFLWVGTTLYLHNLAMVMCNNTSDTQSFSSKKNTSLTLEPPIMK